MQSFRYSFLQINMIGNRRTTLFRLIIYYFVEHIYFVLVFPGHQWTHESISNLLSRNFEQIFGIVGWKCTLEKMDLFHRMEVLFPEYFHSISRIFPFHGKHFHTMELDKAMEIGLSNPFLQYFQNISKGWKRPDFSSGLIACITFK